MTRPDEIDMLAAEYALGTLDVAERAAVSARRTREPELDAAIADWESRLGALSGEVAELPPPPGLLARIEAALDRPAPGRIPRAGETDQRIVRLERALGRWRRSAMAAGALAAALALVIGLRETVWRPAPQSFVAVFQKDDARPAFMLAIDLESRRLTIRPIAAERVSGKTYQLWIASDRLGPQPRSLGLLDDGSRPAQKTLEDYDRSLLQEATFGISVEPPGGSPSGRPTGPALHAKLYPATP